MTGTTSSRGHQPPPDDYRAPEWLRYARAIFFEGYAAPVHPAVKHFDARQLVEVSKELGGDTLRFQPIGYRATYPSKVFPTFPEMGSRDLIDEVSRECRRVGLHLYCYSMLAGGLDADVIDDPRYAPFVLRAVDGKPPKITTGYGNGRMVVQCGTGDPYRQMARAQARELCEHDIDGVYYDAPSGYRGVCFCDSCRAGFRKATGMDVNRLANVRDLDALPADTDMEALGAWYEWANRIVEEDLVDLRAIMHRSGKFMLCHNGATWRPGAFHPQYRYADGFMVEYSEEFYQRLLRALMGAAMARPTRKLAQTYMGSYDVAANGHPLHTRPWCAHILNLEDGDEIRMEGFADLAGGNMPLYGVVNRLLYGLGEGSTEPVKDVYALARRAESLLKDSVPVPWASIVPTAECLEMFRGRKRSWNVMMSEGMALVMLDERLSFDVVPNLELTPEVLARQQVIMLCGASAITDADARLLGEWVKGGGGLLATYDSGLYRENGQIRTDGGALRDILGVEMTADAPDGQADAFYRVTTTHPALGSDHEGAMVMGDAMLMAVTPRDGATVLAECVNVGTDGVRGPAIVVNQHGKGRALYVGGSLEAHYAASRVPSLRRVLTSMVRWLAKDAPAPFSLDAPRGVYGILRQSPSGDLALWIVANVGFKDAAVGRMRQEYMPVPGVLARVLIPEGRRLAAVELLRAQEQVAFTMEGFHAVFALPPLHIAELVHLRFA
jgi:hypothetical protein